MLTLHLDLLPTVWGELKLYPQRETQGPVRCKCSHISENASSVSFKDGNTLDPPSAGNGRARGPPSLIPSLLPLHIPISLCRLTKWCMSPLPLCEVMTRRSGLRLLAASWVL